MTVPAQVRTIAADYLSIVDKRAPGLVRGLYLVGSVALNDFQPHASDIDFVAVTDNPLDPSETEAVRRAHAELARRHRRPHFDGPYVTWADLANDPRKAGTGPQVHENGRVHPNIRGERHHVTWQTLAQCGVTVRGPVLSTVDLWTDEAGLIESIHENMDAYWRPWHRKAARPLSNLGLATLIDWGPAWSVLGVGRLHYTLATGEITSKTGAGVHARDTFPAEWHKLVDECLRIRRGHPQPSLYQSRRARRLDALAFLDHILTTTRH